MFGGNGDCGTWSSGRRLAMFWRRRASTRMSLSSPQNSACENLASFCRPWFLVADRCGFVGKNGTPPISGFGEQVDQTGSIQDVKLRKFFNLFFLTRFHLPSVDFLIQIHHQLLKHLVGDQLELPASNLQMLVDLHAALLGDDEVLTALKKFKNLFSRLPANLRNSLSDPACVRTGSKWSDRWPRSSLPPGARRSAWMNFASPGRSRCCRDRQSRWCPLRRTAEAPPAPPARTSRPPAAASSSLCPRWRNLGRRPAPAA